VLMRILFVTAEVGPFVTVGGLSQVSYFLPNSLQKLGEDVRIFTPKFGAMEQTRKKWKLEMEYEGLRVPLGNDPGNTDLICNIKRHSSTTNVTTYFLENREYYELRANVFGYKDDHVRFMLLCKGCLEWLLLQKEKGEWWPNIIHCNDWHTAYLIELARRVPRYKKIFSEIKIVLTVHNFVYQGNYDFKYCSTDERDDGKDELMGLMEPGMQKQNALLRGVLYADAISTVSPTHAKEVLTEEYGEGLATTLQKRQTRLVGILNGLDTATFDPSRDPLLKSHFTATNFGTRRGDNKRELQKLFNLPVDPEVFLVGYVGRLAQQKGVDLIIETLPHLLDEHSDLQIVILGGGDERYRKDLARLQERYPLQIGLHLLPNFKMPHKLFAGTDAVLLPSMFEPGGIVALEALRYGSVPIVRRTGGLNDIVKDFSPSGEGNGFSFIKRDAWALYGVVITAMTVYRNKPLWKTLVKNCLELDFSWDYAAKQYQKWYSRVRIET